MSEELERTTAYRMVGPGWHTLIDELYDFVAQFPNVRVWYVKEKFGGLRCGTIYLYDQYGGILDNAIDYNALHEGIYAIEHKSKTICEQCGATGELRHNHGWYVTLCPNCFKTKYYGEF